MQNYEASNADCFPAAPLSSIHPEWLVEDPGEGEQNIKKWKGSAVKAGAQMTANSNTNKLLSETTSTGNAAFPWRLHDLLNDAKQRGFENIVSWQQDGKGFKVHRQKDFADIVMPSYFNQSQYKSFQRQLNIYGFQRKTVGAERGAYSHELLIRGKPDICRFMVRTKIKRKGSRSSLLLQEQHQSQLFHESCCASLKTLSRNSARSCPVLQKSNILNLSGGLLSGDEDTISTKKNEQQVSSRSTGTTKNAPFCLQSYPAQRLSSSPNPFLFHQRGEGVLKEDEEGEVHRVNAHDRERGEGSLSRRHSLSFLEDPIASPESVDVLIATSNNDSPRSNWCTNNSLWQSSQQNQFLFPDPVESMVEEDVEDDPMAPLDKDQGVNDLLHLSDFAEDIIRILVSPQQHQQVATATSRQWFCQRV
jgi:hypothetical protein